MTEKLLQRQITELSERLQAVQNERDILRSIIGQYARSMSRVMIECELLDHQLKYFNDARREVNARNGSIRLETSRI